MEHLKADMASGAPIAEPQNRTPCRRRTPCRVALTGTAPSGSYTSLMLAAEQACSAASMRLVSAGKLFGAQAGTLVPYAPPGGSKTALTSKPINKIFWLDTGSRELTGVGHLRRARLPLVAGALWPPKQDGRHETHAIASRRRQRR
jgi:hypothetical protein